jgi:hypothetical protein
MSFCPQASAYLPVAVSVVNPDRISSAGASKQWPRGIRAATHFQSQVSVFSQLDFYRDDGFAPDVAPVSLAGVKPGIAGAAPIVPVAAFPRLMP